MRNQYDTVKSIFAILAIFVFVIFLLNILGAYNQFSRQCLQTSYEATVTKNFIDDSNYYIVMDSTHIFDVTRDTYAVLNPGETYTVNTLNCTYKFSSPTEELLTWEVTE